MDITYQTTGHRILHLALIKPLEIFKQLKIAKNITHDLLNILFSFLLKNWQMIQIFGLPVLMYDIMRDREKSHTSEFYTQLIPSPCGSNVKQLLDEVL